MCQFIGTFCSPHGSTVSTFTQKNKKRRERAHENGALHITFIRSGLVLPCLLSLVSCFFFSFPRRRRRHRRHCFQLSKTIKNKPFSILCTEYTSCVELEKFFIVSQPLHIHEYLFGSIIPRQFCGFFFLEKINKKIFKSLSTFPHPHPLSLCHCQKFSEKILRGVSGLCHVVNMRSSIHPPQCPNQFRNFLSIAKQLTWSQN